ncbi:hypothetical protein BBP40_009879 [Aspergillus hancockii]|nr:hypothetical protein BBP40_009879 [Aspergillus hancockii]
MNRHEMKQISPVGLREVEIPTRENADDAELVRLGKRPVLKRNFGLMSILGFSCTVLVTWEGIVMLFSQAFQNGGFAGSVYGFLFCWVGVTATFVMLSELVSMAPTSGGQYHWCSMLAPASTMKLLSYITAWLTVIGWHATVAASLNVVGNYIPTMITVTHPDYAPQGWHKALFAWATGILCLAFNIIGGKFLPRLEVYVPRALMLTVLINGSLGFSILLAFLFCVGDVDKALNHPTGLPFMGVLLQATKSVTGTLVLTSLLIVLAFCNLVGMLASASRQLWSFSRDRGMPGWRLWTKVTKRTSIPTYTVILTTSIICLLNLISIGSPVAFNSLVAMSTSGLYISYVVVASLLLYRRCTGGIMDRDSDRGGQGSDVTIVNTAGARIVWGPFHIRGLPGIAVNCYAIFYLLTTTFFSLWPPHNHPNVETMNYSVVGTIGTILLSLLYYFTRARGVYTGPVVEI